MLRRLDWYVSKERTAPIVRVKQSKVTDMNLYYKDIVSAFQNES